MFFKPERWRAAGKGLCWAGRHPNGGPERAAASLSGERLLPSVLLVPVELNSVSDSSRRHSPTKRIASINAGRGGVRWACTGWSEAVELGKRGMGQDGTSTLSSPSEDYTSLVGFFFSKVKGSRAVNETKVKRSRRDIWETCRCRRVSAA